MEMASSSSLDHTKSFKANKQFFQNHLSWVQTLLPRAASPKGRQVLINQV